MLLCRALELGIWPGYIAVAWVFLPPCWAIPCACPAWSPGAPAVVARVIIAGGALIGFGSMAWVGVGRSFGRPAAEFHASGPYRWSHNPQIPGGSLMVVGVGWLWPSAYALGWAALWAVLGHWMVVTEEEHLERTPGQAYREYCARVPRYCGLGRRV